VLHKKVGDAVEAGESLATVHGRTTAAADSILARITAAFQIREDAAPRPLLLRRVTASGIEQLAT
jgi:thymidine phosphorylase